MENNQKTLYNHLIDQLQQLESREQLEDFINAILTPQELEQICLRLEIIKRLKKNQNQRQITTDLGVGIATVTRGARELKMGKFQYV